jgi:hypothetical protein
MRRVLALPFIAVALLIPAGLATAALDDVKGPACADITGSDFAYHPDGEAAEVTLFLDTASCPSISYTLTVLNSAAIQTSVNSNFVRGDGVADNTSGPGTDSVTVVATVPLGDRDGQVCLYATTSAGRHVFDRAPDADLSPNCLELGPGGTGGGGGFN